MFIDCNGKQYSTYDKSPEAIKCQEEHKEKWHKAEKACKQDPECIRSREYNQIIIYSISFLSFIGIIILANFLFKQK